MKKHLFSLLALLFIFSPLAAQEEEAAKKPVIEFFSDDVPRYTKLAVGIFGSNQYGLGGWGGFAPVMLGGGVDIEYALPLNLKNNLDFGLAAHIDYTHIFPNKDSTLKRDDDIGAVFSAWLRIPFLMFNQRFAFQPEIGYGLIFHNAEGQNGSTAHGWYMDQVTYLAPSVRWIPPKLDTLEIEVAPFYTFAPEQYNHTLNQLGFRVGLIWHIDSFIKEKAKEREDKIRAEEEAKRQAEIERLKKEAEEADEAERARIEEELRKAEEEQKAREEAKRIKREAEEARRAEIASWPNPLATLTAEGANNFAPDGDGLNDTVTLFPGIQYIEENPDGWVILIKDPQGHDFKTFKGSGLPPESVVWDGKSDKGETVVSKNTYTAVLTVTPSRTDRLRTKELTVETEIKVNTGLLLQEIIPEHEWKIVVQTINFDPDAATFNKLSDEQIRANHETLDEVAQQIKEHPGAKVIIEGYANNVSGTEKEDREELIPLSQKRAEAIIEELAKRGIDPEILTAKGMGGANPIAARRDRDNWWKNRRVEFRIVK